MDKLLTKGIHNDSRGSVVELPPWSQKNIPLRHLVHQKQSFYRQCSPQRAWKRATRRYDLLSTTKGGYWLTLNEPSLVITKYHLTQFILATVHPLEACYLSIWLSWGPRECRMKASVQTLAGKNQWTDHTIASDRLLYWKQNLYWQCIPNKSRYATNMQKLILG